LISITETPPTETTLEFAPGRAASASFQLAFLPVAFDFFDSLINVSSTFSGISSLSLEWTFSTLQGKRDFQDERRLFSLLLAVLGVFCARSATFERDSFTQLFALLLAAAGAFACNPLASLGDRDALRISDHCLAALFDAILRLYFMIGLELLRTRAQVPGRPVALAFGAFFGIYAIVDATAGYDREVSWLTAATENAELFQSEQMLIVFHTIYICISAVEMVSAGISHDLRKVRRCVFFVTGAWIIDASTFSIQILCVIAEQGTKTVALRMIVAAVNGGVAGMGVLAMTCGGRPLEGKQEEVEELPREEKFELASESSLSS
jgi:hypothetical protein